MVKFQGYVLIYDNRPTIVWNIAFIFWIAFDGNASISDIEDWTDIVYDSGVS
jgi:hypothetical protein